MKKIIFLTKGNFVGPEFFLGSCWIPPAIRSLSPKLSLQAAVTRVPRTFIIRKQPPGVCASSVDSHYFLATSTLPIGLEGFFQVGLMKSGLAAYWK